MPVIFLLLKFTNIKWLSVPLETNLNPYLTNSSPRTLQFKTTLSIYVLKLESKASLKHTALAAIICIKGPPCIPGKIFLSKSLAYFSLQRINPPLGPLNVLWVVEVTKSAYGTGDGWAPVATKPAIWAISTIK